MGCWAGQSLSHGCSAPFDMQSAWTPNGTVRAKTLQHLLLSLTCTYYPRMKGCIATPLVYLIIRSLQTSKGLAEGKQSCP